MSDTSAWKLKIDPPESDSPFPMWRGTLTLPVEHAMQGFFSLSRAGLIADARKFKAEYLNPPPRDVVDI